MRRLNIRLSNDQYDVMQDVGGLDNVRVMHDALEGFFRDTWVKDLNTTGLTRSALPDSNNRVRIELPLSEAQHAIIRSMSPNRRMASTVRKAIGHYVEQSGYKWPVGDVRVGGRRARAGRKRGR